MSHIAPQIYSIPVGATRNIAVSFENELESGESLTGTPTVVEDTSTDLTIDNKTVNTSTITVLDTSVTAGRAVQFRVSGQLANTMYTINITCSTDAAPAQTIIASVTFKGVAV